MDGLWATKSEGVGLIDRAVSFQDFQPMSSRYLIVTDGQTDRRTDVQADESNLITALCTSASRGKNAAVDFDTLGLPKFTATSRGPPTIARLSCLFCIVDMIEIFRVVISVYDVGLLSCKCTKIYNQ